MGEVLAAQPLVERLKACSGRAVFVSTTTETGQRLARERLQSADGIFYFPLDWVVPVRRALRAIRPAMVIIMETEIWPNFLREASRSANSRGLFECPHLGAVLCPIQALEVPRRRVLLSSVLRDVEAFLAQTPQDAARLREMGAPEDRIEVIGNLKYDSEPPRSHSVRRMARRADPAAGALAGVGCRERGC